MLRGEVMARAKNGSNGRLEEAMTLLIQNQASFVAQRAETNRHMAELDRINSERFRRIEAILLEHSRFLADHARILEALPDAIRDKIGFKAPSSPK
jgi:hypothetical protein